MTSIRTIMVRIGAERRVFNGRFAWALENLIRAGERGCTPIDHPGPRWSHYVFVLRREGLSIDTVEERHGGPYPGRHARYVLRSSVEILELQGGV
jgi:hypothetical protein